MVDISRATTGVNLPPAVASDIWQTATEQSAVMQLATRFDLPGSGVSIPIITGDPVANWVGETAKKPVSRGTVTNKTLRGYTIAVIEPFSNQFRRDLPALYRALAGRLPAALALKFDKTVFGIDAVPGSDFDTLASATSVGITGETYKGLLAAYSAIATGGGELDGWALAPQGKSLLLGETDSTGRPLFTSGIGSDAVPTILGAPTYTTKGVYAADADGAGAGTAAQIGFAGDWSSAAYGVVEDVTISISDQATLDDGGTQINLWQQNMFAVRAEIEVGFRVRDIAHFAKLTNAVQA